MEMYQFCWHEFQFLKDSINTLTKINNGFTTKQQQQQHGSCC